ncbi:MAG: hypothetical protein PHN64_09385 [Desulfovibrionaceae bacterium]|nr:hypothetical protein [Desulfovibrionaceae bacterium]
MPIYFSPTGNPEVWEQQPQGYYTTYEEWKTTLPPPMLAEVQADKLTEIAAAYDSVLAYVVAPEGKDNLAAALAVADFTADDPEGLAFIRTKLAARKKELEEAVNAAGSVGNVQAIAVSFDV